MTVDDLMFTDDSDVRRWIGFGPWKASKNFSFSFMGYMALSLRGKTL